MILLAIAALATASPVYKFASAGPLTYKVRIAFDGYLPLLGGQEGQAEANAKFALSSGQAAENASESAELTDFSVKFNGFQLPIDVDSAKRFFPKATFTYTPLGKVVAWNAPDVTIPVRLPGLDLKYLPELIFMPIEFPAQITTGQSYPFEKPLSGGTAKYTVTPVSVDGNAMQVQFTVEQQYETLEDEANQIVTEKDAVAKVVTKDTGIGTGTFDIANGRFTSVQIKDVALSDVTDLQTKAIKHRKLSRNLTISS